jgi:hypothetical protein
MLTVSFHDAVQVLGKLKQGFESGVLGEVDMGDVDTVKEAYGKVKTGTRAKNMLVNRNL